MFCSKCGAIVGAQQAFCARCGRTTAIAATAQTEQGELDRFEPRDSAGTGICSLV
jgi:uncharacterized OB-fold protein